MTCLQAHAEMYMALPMHTLNRCTTVPIEAMNLLPTTLQGTRPVLTLTDAPKKQPRRGGVVVKPMLRLLTPTRGCEPD